MGSSMGNELPEQQEMEQMTMFRQRSNTALDNDPTFSPAASPSSAPGAAAECERWTHFLQLANEDPSASPMWEERHSKDYAQVHVWADSSGGPAIVRSLLSFPDVPAPVLMSALHDHDRRSTWDGLLSLSTQLSTTIKADGEEQLVYFKVRCIL
jgi:hypothetical protein